MKNFPVKLVSTCVLLTAGSASFGVGLPAEGRQAFQPANWVAASDERLDRMRGGFDAGSGLSVSFGIVRTVTINGNIVTKISFNVPDVSKITAETARIVSAALASAGIVQNGAGNAVGTGVRSESAAATPGTTTLSQTTQDVSSRSAAVDARPAASTLSPGAVEVAVKSAPETNPVAATLSPTVVDPGVRSQLVAGAAIGTVIQNSLNDQKIQTLTVVNAGVNSLGLLKTINTQAALKEALFGAVGVR